MVGFSHYFPVRLAAILSDIFTLFFVLRTAVPTICGTAYCETRTQHVLKLKLGRCNIQLQYEVIARLDMTTLRTQIQDPHHRRNQYLWKLCIGHGTVIGRYWQWGARWVGITVRHWAKFVLSVPQCPAGKVVIGIYVTQTLNQAVKGTDNSSGHIWVARYALSPICPGVRLPWCRQKFRADFHYPTRMWSWLHIRLWRYTALDPSLEWDII